MARKASAKTGTKRAKAAPNAKKTASRTPARKPAKPKTRVSARAKPQRKDMNAADALIELVESPLVADLLAAAVTAAAATILEHKLRKREKGSLVRAVGAATAAAVGRQLASEIEEIREAAKKPGSGKAR